jgi:hypothetical protein
MMTIFAFVAGYFALLVLLSLIARPSRVRIAELAGELSCEQLSEKQKRMLRSVVESAYSMRSAPAHFLFTVAHLLTPSEKFDQRAREWAALAENRAIIEDHRWAELFDRYTVSIIAVNPIFGALLSLARLLFRLKARLYAKRVKQPAIDPATLEIYGELKAAAA